MSAIERRRWEEESWRNDRLKLPRSRVHHYEKERPESAAGETAAISVEIKGFSTPSLGITRQPAFAETREGSGKKRSLRAARLSEEKSPATTRENFLKEAATFHQCRNRLFMHSP